MKHVLLMMAVVLVVAGCLREVETETQTETETGKTEKSLSPEEKLVGSYEAKSHKLVFLKNGKVEYYIKSIKEERETDWELVGKEVHVDFENFSEQVLYKVQPNGDLTKIAEIVDGKRTDIPKEKQYTYKKIK